MKKILYTFLPIVSILIISCQKQDVASWSGYDRIGFTTAMVSDTIKSYSFVFDSEDINSATVLVEVSTEGKIHDYDRSVRINQAPSFEGVEAIPGVHYVPFDDPSVKGLYVVPAGKHTAMLPIVLKRDKSLKDQEVTLRIILSHQEGDDFLLSANEVKLHRTIIFADVLTQPEIWATLSTNPTYNPVTYLGYYGPVKHRFMIESMGMSFDNDHFQTLFWYHNATWGWRTYDVNYLLFLQRTLQTKLEKRNELENSILKEADGRVVDFYNYP